jgi:hypothetical protein
LLTIAVTNVRSVFLQRHVFWRKLSADERANVSASDGYRWVGLDEVANMDLDTETSGFIGKLRIDHQGKNTFRF